MSVDDLFAAYKAKVSLLLKAGVPFGEHQKQAFRLTVGAELERLSERPLASSSAHPQGMLDNDAVDRTFPQARAACMSPQSVHPQVFSPPQEPPGDNPSSSPHHDS